MLDGYTETFCLKKRIEINQNGTNENGPITTAKGKRQLEWKNSLKDSIHEHSRTCKTFWSFLPMASVLASHSINIVHPL